jgi:TonB family protein
MRLHKSFLISALLHLLFLLLPFREREYIFPVQLLEQKKQTFLLQDTPTYISKLPSLAPFQKRGSISLQRAECKVKKGVILPPLFRPGPAPLFKESSLRMGVRGPAASRKVLYKESFKVPRWLEEMGISLQGSVKFWVLPSGMVEDVVLEESFGFGAIDELACKAVSRWRFAPSFHQKVQWGIVQIKILLQ